MLPDSVVIDGHMDFLLAMQSEVLETIEKGPASGGLTRTDAFECRHPSLGGDMVHAKDENKALVPHILAGRGNRQRDGMSSRDVKGGLWGPVPFMLKSAHASFLDVEDGLHHASLP